MYTVYIVARWIHDCDIQLVIDAQFIYGFGNITRSILVKGKCKGLINSWNAL